jgi:predicted nucleic acid-binding protein
MTTAVFADSTTLIYPLDREAPGKAKLCEGWLRTLREADGLVLSPQVLNESYWVVRRKPQFAYVRPKVRSYLGEYVPWVSAPLIGTTLQEAFAIEDKFGVRFWDALLLASADAAGCSHFLSEDLNDGQAYGGVTVVNPFRHLPEDVLGAAARL